ncbi:kinase-like protein [Aspergillus ibericus CBS 121593]|uniref:Kinase-like protein n=1 Tax=Aspergillus ibericus CBS 121593 TaxID=1448316 RepID=A0A395HE26_9EURO|nr:kinase-like protein [Aspergillus ibericus CBS 121593]RAL06127.1 kinase-like protein [Aspergillus ibericus CBS 121593]
MVSLRSFSPLAFRSCRNQACTILSPLRSTLGSPGRNYEVERVLQEEKSPIRHIYLARSENQQYILKYIHSVNYQDLEDINNRLRNTKHVRLLQDTIPEKSMFVFDYFKDHLLHLAQKDLPIDTTKRILKDALRGLAELHDQDIVHTDIKANNIFIDWEEDQNGISVRKVKIGDLEDAAHIPAGSDMIGKQAGNWMWRSPEAHASGPINKPSDIFSFALVCIWAVYKHVIFAVGDDELEEGVHPLSIVIERQISYFADADGMDAFLRYLREDNPWVRVFEVVRDGFGEDNPRRPFALWKGIDEDFKNLICAMTRFDPEKRITAREALAHRWFEGV